MRRIFSVWSVPPLRLCLQADKSITSRFSFISTLPRPEYFRPPHLGIWCLPPGLRLSTRERNRAMSRPTSPTSFSSSCNLSPRNVTTRSDLAQSLLIGNSREQVKARKGENGARGAVLFLERFGTWIGRDEVVHLVSTFSSDGSGIRLDLSPCRSMTSATHPIPA